ncbi:NifB/NifX family molybdenum-iron cluster-binding protein [Trichloromonas sp.]|uniref:NifB/NifX family molybdenum-iron cluster-binding protein n=1 Tax=Trichloromonas sp. TaxID=3069249 RepID=UPI003D815A57
MKICFPVESNEGLESSVFGHFGSAPSFIIVDTETGGIEEIDNGDRQHSHGACSPLKALGGQSVDGIVVGGVGGGALSRLNQLGFTVYRAMADSVAENLAALALNELSVVTPEQTCGGHGSGQGHGQGCGHE